MVKIFMRLFVTPPWRTFTRTDRKQKSAIIINIDACLAFQFRLKNANKFKNKIKCILHIDSSTQLRIFIALLKRKSYVLLCEASHISLKL